MRSTPGRPLRPLSHRARPSDPRVNEVRGEDTVARISRKLQQAYKTLPFKAFLMGHPGVGKSTEISRLLEHVKEQHVGVRLSIATELNPASFKVFDVLLLMPARLAEEADRMKAIPLGGILFRAFGFRYRTVVWS